jgi:NADPH-dependent curcumin reductase CurA
MSALGLTSITAYLGLIGVGRPVVGETDVVSGAAGATGSVVGQIAKIKAFAIGIAGEAEKCHWLTDEAGFDAMIDYKSEDIQARLKELCPKGIDIFFDNVAGDILAGEVRGRIEARTSRPLVAPFRGRHPDRAPRVNPRRHDSRA